MLLYLAVAIGPMLLGFWAQWRVQSTFKKFSQQGTYRGMSGAQIARNILDSQGLYEVGVERVDGFLSDHYDPSSKVLRLSPDVYDGTSVSAAGVAAHEAGHALQDKQGYFMLQVRSLLVPGVQIGGWVGPLMLFAGMLLNISGLAWLGVILFGLTAIFSLVTLPVEFDASHRAKQLLVAEGIMYREEMQGVNSVLDAAALTYVAAAIQAVATLLYYVFILTGSSDD